MPVLIIAVVFFAIFLVMGAMSISAVVSERRYEREQEKAKAKSASAVGQ